MYANILFPARKVKQYALLLKHRASYLFSFSFRVPFISHDH